LIKKILYTLILISLAFKSELYAQQGKVDITFNILDDGLNGDGFDKAVRTLFLQSDNNLLVGGEYTSLNGISTPYFTRLKPDGTIDESFNTGTGFNDKVYTSYNQPDGKIIVGGSFTSYNGINAGRLIRLNTDSSYDPTFNTSIGSTTGIIYGVFPQSDGKIIIVGSFTKYNNITVNRIARILPNGALDTSFLTGLGASALISNVRILSDGKILLTGNFTSFNGVEVNKMVQLNANGTVDTSFNIGTGFDDDVSAMEIQSDGKIILGGKFTSYNGIVANRIIRINKDGSIDTSFLSGSGLSAGAVQAIKIDSFGNIMIGGSFTGFYNGKEVNRICFLNADGTMKTDIDFGSGPASSSVLALANDSEGSWYIGGSFSVFDGLNQGRLTKINEEGEHDTGYLSSGIGFDNSVYKVLPLANKKTMVSGKFTKFNGVFSSRITRLLEDGSIDNTFNLSKSGANNIVKTAVLQSDGKIILAGNFTKYNETTSNRIVRILPDGAIDDAFNIGSGFNSQVYTMALQSDGKVIVAGNFTQYNNDKSVIRIVRLLPNGSRDLTFNVGTGADAIIESMLIQPDGKILVGGRFNTFNGRSILRLVRLNPDGSIDTSFNIGTGFDKNVFAIALQSDQKIMVGGSFLIYNGTSQKRILRLNANGSLDATFDSGIGFSKGEVHSILVQPDDRILVGGTFSGTYKGNVSLRLIRLLKTGDIDTSFEAPLNNNLHTMAFTADYRLIIGGDFNSVSGISKHRVARLKLCLESTIWNGTSWSNGLPSGGKEISFKADYPNLSTTNVCSCTIDEGKKVTLNNGNTLGIEFSYTGSGILVLEDSASLYQSDDDMINTGIIHLKRKTKPILRYDYTFWSSPVDHQKLIDVSPDTLDDKFLSYDAILNNWKFEQSSNTMTIGVGYDIRGPQGFSITEPSGFEATFKGIPNNGKVEVKLGRDNSFNLIGNPYPSALNADTFLISNASKINGTLYFWTHNTPVTNYKYTSDDYAVYNLLGGVGTKEALSTGVNESIPDGTIASAQGFFVKSKTERTLEFNNNMRIAGSNSSFFKPGKNDKEANKSSIEKHRIWLNFKNNEGAFKQILLGYVDGATNQYDENYDAPSFNGNQFVDFYSVIENKKLVIQGRALPFVETDSIVLGYKTNFEGNFSFSIDHKDGLFNGLDVFIEDKDSKIIHNLQNGSYIFNSQKGTFDNRFVLKFIDKTFNTDDFEFGKDNVFVSVKNKLISINAFNENIKEVEIFDTLGHKIYQKRKIENTQIVIENLFSSH
jgi:uncharacterized delta-60 repeat protein